MQITTVGLDLAKNVFQVHGVNRHGEVDLRKQLKRDQVATFFANLPACVIGMAACSSAHHWARKLQALGHTVRLCLFSPSIVKHVQPRVRGGGCGDRDAAAIPVLFRGLPLAAGM